MSLALSVMKSNMSRYIPYNIILISYAFVETVDHWCNFRRPKALIYPYQAGLFSHLPVLGMRGRGGGGGAQRPGCQKSRLPSTG